MEQQPIPTAQIRDQIFARAIERLDATPDERTAQLLGRRQEEVARTRGLDGLDAAADEQRCDAAARGLDLRQLGHRDESSRRPIW